MKNTRLFFLVIPFVLGLSSTKMQSQTGKWFGEVWSLPVMASLGNHGAKEFGAGYYDFYMRQRVAQEYGLSAGRRFGAHWEAGIGVSRKNIRQEFGYKLPAPSDDTRLLERAERSYDFIFFGVRAFAGYTWQKHTLRLIVELNDPYRIQRSPDTTWFNKIVLFQSQGTIASFELDERISPEGFPGDYIIPEISYGFQLNPNISILAGTKWKWYGNTNNYRLLITGNTFESPLQEAILNDIRLRNRFFMVYAGINFRLAWGKK